MTTRTDVPTAPGDTLIFENDRVRIWSMTLEPGGMFDFHQPSDSSGAPGQAASL